MALDYLVLLITAECHNLTKYRRKCASRLAGATARQAEELALVPQEYPPVLVCIGQFLIA